MTEKGQARAVEILFDWIKWLVATNLAAVTGCVIVLERGTVGVTRFFLVLAIASFAFSLLVAAVLLGFTPSLMQRLPLRDERGDAISIYDSTLWAGIRLKVMIWAEFALLLVAMFFFMGWVVF